MSERLRAPNNATQITGVWTATSTAVRAPFVRPEVTLIGPMVELTLQFGGTFTTP